MIKRTLNFRVLILILAGSLSVFAVIKFVAIKNKAVEKLVNARTEQAWKNEIPFAKTTRQPLDRKGIEIWQSTKNVRSVALFLDSLFAATDGGLVQISETGEIYRHFTVLDGLPESDLTALAVFAGKLFIGTPSNGLLTFDGERFENYRWRDREAKSITALLTDGNRILIGTFAGGLIEFDGSSFHEIKPENETIKSVNFLFKNETKLFVGTFDNGLWLTEAGRWRHFTVADGLPSNRVVGIALQVESVYIGTDLGVVQTDSKELFVNNQTKIFHQLAVIPALSSLTFFNNQILACRDDGEIFTLTGGKGLENLEWNKPGELANARLSVENGNLWLLGGAGIWQLREKNSFGIWFASFEKSLKETLSDNIVSALAIDRKNRLWAGTFRNGIDVFSSAGEKLAHLENESLREINFLLSQNQMIAATAHGATNFDESLRGETLTKDAGLLSNSVMHVSANGNDKLFATSRGLSFTTNNRLRGLTSVNGLPSDNVYAALFYRNSVFAGTLGGLVQIENGRVVRTFKDSNSKLTNNWVSALCEAGGRLFVGTYGGGVLELTAAGELHAFAGEIGKFAVNPNAMFADEQRLYIGTLDGAFVLDLSSQKWTRVTDELPAKTVLSIAGDEQNVYFGTTSGIALINKDFWLDGSKNE